MALLTSSYNVSITQYRRYIEAVRNRPLFRASLFIVLSLLLLIVLVAFALRPTLLTIAGLYGELDSQRQIATQLDQHIKDQAAAAQKYNQILPQLPLLAAAIPGSPSLEPWSSGLDKYASESGVQIVAVKIAKTPISKQSTGAIEKPEFDLTVRGEFTNLKSFLKLIESSHRLSPVGNITITKGQGQSLQNILQLQISGQILFSKQ